MKKWNKDNPEKIKKSKRKYRKAHSERINESDRKCKKTKLEKIAGRKKPEQCEVCGAFGRIVFDHDHKTGEFRGWICNRCNVALGMANDNIEILELLIKYLKQN